MILILFVFIVLQSCMEGQKYRFDYMWAQAMDSYYRLHNLGTQWHKAKQICEAEGTLLLIPDSLSEMENLKVLMSNMKAEYTDIFLGIHDKYADGNFVTLKGVPISGTVLDRIWAEDQPDNKGGAEHCVVMTREGLMDDRPCTDPYPFMCKIYENDTKYNEPCDNYDAGYAKYPNASNNKCYKFHEEPLSWYDAYMVCKQEEGRLAIMNSAKEASVIVNFLKNHQDSFAPDTNILYLGFSDLMFPYQYRTIEDDSLEDAGYASWSTVTNEPVAENFTKFKRCGGMSQTALLEVYDCDVPAMFLCEKIIQKQPGTSTIPNSTPTSTTTTTISSTKISTKSRPKLSGGTVEVETTLAVDTEVEAETTSMESIS